MPDAVAAPLSGSPAPRDSLPPANRKAMGALMMGLALATLDTAIANTALPAIAASLHTTPAASVWIINAYQLAMVATLLPFAALGDRLGHKRVFVAGLSLFVLASLLCAVSPTLLALTIARILQGLGASAVMSVNLALIRFLYPPHRLGRGVGLNALVAGVSMATGPTVASLLLSVAPWPWLFAVNIPFGVAAIVFAIPNLPVAPRRDHHFDGIAALLNGAAFAALVFGFVEAAQRAPWPVPTAAIGTAALLIVVLMRREAGHPAPMLPVDLFRRPMFALSTITALCSFCAQGLAFVALPFYFETVLGRGQIETGFLMTPWPLFVAIIAPVAGRLSDRYPPGLLGGVGLGVLSAGMASLVLMPAHPNVLDICVRMALCGMGFGFFQSPNLKAFMTSAPPERSGGASGVIGTARLLGQASGAALVALSFGLSGHHGPLLALVWGAVFAGVGCVASGLRLMTPVGDPRKAPPGGKRI
ncbi:MFS transporter [Robbsia sp. Bb-Pol-6]|uniref:MFS transporter n=1 Tax=Robbsia betulipollinis TaxID=2981849 RepID=A0ABT3ZI87_9BURK|nr:MFS transporter [Robbsia betulipollinis]MCY0385698.1 MFS transporter [Robbsia betulipollinis]